MILPDAPACRRCEKHGDCPRVSGFFSRYAAAANVCGVDITVSDMARLDTRLNKDLIKYIAAYAFDKIHVEN